MRLAVTASLVAALGLATLQGVPAAAAPAPVKASLNVAAAKTQCDMSFPAKKGARRAGELMAGRVNLGQYGRFRLAENPTWKPVSSLDSSGKGHMHSLHWLLPLLRNGVRTGNAAMVNRFYAVLKDWAKDNGPGAASRRYAWGPPIYEGFRALVLVCAAAGPKGTAPWLLKSLALHGKMLAASSRYEGANNASLHQSMGLYALGEALKRPAWRKVAIQREGALASRLVHADGSDEEGALSYAINNYTWFRQAAERLSRGGDPLPAAFAQVDQIPSFIAHATRPDGKIEALGDTSPVQLNPASWPGTQVEYAASSGTSGPVPSGVFNAYSGGYVFGRSGWGQSSRPFTDETFYSLRAGATKFIPHAHDDAGSLTLYSHGAPLLVDTGQWRYLYGPTRSFVVSRAAHNVVVVKGVARSDQGHPELSSTTVNGIDVTTIVDRGYRGVTITRTVAYDRTDDVVLVWDRLTSSKSVNASQQWGLERTRDVTVGADSAQSTGPGGNVSMLFTSGGAPLDVAKGKREPLRGWNSQAYGEFAPSPSVRATQKGSSLSWLTVIAPRAEGVAASTVSATSTVSESAATVSLTTAAGSSTVTLNNTGASRTGHAAIAPILTPTEGIVLAGDTTRMQVRGLPPRGPVTLEAQPVGAEAPQPVATSTASVAGTATFNVPVGATAAYRAMAGDGPSAASQVVAAVAPSAPQTVTAVPSAPGQVQVSWVAPVDSGGAPLTRYAVRVDGKKVTEVAPGATSVVVKGLVPGSRTIAVRALNQVATSVDAPAVAAVPAYPTVTGPVAARKGTTVKLTLHGLLKGTPTAVSFTPARSGRVTKAVKVRSDGTAIVRVVVKKTLRLVVTNGETRSAPHRIKVPKKRR